MSRADTAIDHVHGSNLPRHVKSTLTDWYQKVTSVGEADLAPRGSTRSHLTHQIGAFRQLVGSGATGAALGVLSAKMPHGLDAGRKGKLAIDGIGGALGAFAGAAMAAQGVPFGNDVRNAGAVAFGIFSFRKAHDFQNLRHERRAAGRPAGVHGEEDEIIAAARALD